VESARRKYLGAVMSNCETSSVAIARPDQVAVDTAWEIGLKFRRAGFSVSGSSDGVSDGAARGWRPGLR
jgi:hypothetical protein